MVYIITGRGSSYGRTRAEIEENLRGDGLCSMDDEQFDKCKYLEKKSRETLGKEVFVNQGLIDKAGDITE
jgi:hypothetical protein